MIFDCTGAHTKLDLVSCELRFRIHSNYRLSAFPGSMWRGAFGIALKRLSCRRFPNCAEYCQEPNECVYGRIFETRLQDAHTSLGNVKYAPRPFCLFPVTQGPALIEAGSDLLVNWTLWGDMLYYLPYCIMAWREAGRSGLLPGRIPATLLEVKDLTGDKVIYLDEEDTIGEPIPYRIRFGENDLKTSKVVLKTLSPLRIKHKNRLVGKGINNPISLPADKLFFTILRRIESCFNVAEIADYLKPFYNELSEVKEAQSSLKWTEISRLSRRQNRILQMGGLMGEMSWSSLSPRWLDLLKIGEVLQIGKGTTMGLGKYILTVSDL